MDDAALVEDLDRLEALLERSVDDSFFQDEDRFRALIHIIDVLGADTAADDPDARALSGLDRSQGLAENAAYKSLQAQLSTVDGVIEEVMTTHYKQLNSSVQSMSSAARQFDDIETGVKGLRLMVERCREALQGELQRSSVAELWLRKSEAQKLVDMLDKIQLLREAPLRFDTLTAQRCYFAASALFQKALLTMFDEDLSGVEGLTRIRDKLMERKETILDGLVAEILKVLHLDAGSGIPPLLRASGPGGNKDRRRRRRRGGAGASEAGSRYDGSSWAGDSEDGRSEISLGLSWAASRRGSTPSVRSHDWDKLSLRSGASRTGARGGQSALPTAAQGVPVGLACAVEAPLLSSRHPLDVASATEESEASLCGLRRAPRVRAAELAPGPETDPLLFLKLLCRALARLRLGADARARVREAMNDGLEAVRKRALTNFAEQELGWSRLQALPDVPTDSKRLASFLKYLFDAYGAVLRGHVVFFLLMGRAEALESPDATQPLALEDSEWSALKSLWAQLRDAMKTEIWPHLQDPAAAELAEAGGDELTAERMTELLEGGAPGTPGGQWRLNMQHLLRPKGRGNRRESFGLRHGPSAGNLFGLAEGSQVVGSGGEEAPMLLLEDLVLAEPSATHVVPVLRGVEDFTSKVEVSFLALHRARENSVLGIGGDGTGTVEEEEEEDGGGAGMGVKQSSLRLDDPHTLRKELRALDAQIMDFIRREVIPPLRSASAARIAAAFLPPLIPPLPPPPVGSLRREASRGSTQVLPAAAAAYDALKQLFQIPIQLQSCNALVAEAAETLVQSVITQFRAQRDALLGVPYRLDGTGGGAAGACEAQKQLRQHEAAMLKTLAGAPGMAAYRGRYQRYSWLWDPRRTSPTPTEGFPGLASRGAPSPSLAVEAADTAETRRAHFEEEKGSAPWAGIWRKAGGASGDRRCPFPIMTPDQQGTFGGDAAYASRITHVAALAYACDWFAGKLARTASHPHFSGGEKPKRSGLRGMLGGGGEAAEETARGALRNLLTEVARECCTLSGEMLAALRAEVMQVCLWRVGSVGKEAVSAANVGGGSGGMSGLVSADLLARELREVAGCLLPGRGGKDGGRRLFPEALGLVVVGSVGKVLAKALVQSAGSVATVNDAVVIYLRRTLELFEGVASTLRDEDTDGFESAKEYLRLMAVTLPELEEYVVAHRWRYSREEYLALYVTVAGKRNAGMGLAGGDKELEKRFQNIYGGR